MRRPWPALGRSATGKKTYSFLHKYFEYNLFCIPSKTLKFKVHINNKIFSIWRTEKKNIWFPLHNNPDDSVYVNSSVCFNNYCIQYESSWQNYYSLLFTSSIPEITHISHNTGFWSLNVYHSYVQWRGLVCLQILKWKRNTSLLNKCVFRYPGLALKEFVNVVVLINICEKEPFIWITPVGLQSTSLRDVTLW